MRKKLSIVAVSLCLLFALTFSFFDIIEIIARYMFGFHVAQAPPPPGEVYHPTADPCPPPPDPPPPPPPPKGG